MASMYDVIESAREAGRTAGTAHSKVRNAIREAYSVTGGSITYTDPDAVAMRGAFAEACAASGTTKKNGFGAFARAWDSLVSELGLEARPVRAKGRNSAKAAANAAAAADPDAVSQVVEKLVPRELTKAELKAIQDAAVLHFIQNAAPLVQVESLIEAWAILKRKDAKPSDIADAAYLVAESTKAIGALLIKSNAYTESDIKDAATRAKAPKAAPVKSAPKTKAKTKSKVHA